MVKDDYVMMSGPPFVKYDVARYNELARGSMVCPLPFVKYDVVWCEMARGPVGEAVGTFVLGESESAGE
jgi:hypothetical protein